MTVPAGSAQAARSRRATPARAARPRGRVRWDQLGRLAMLCVLAALLYLYIDAGLSLLSSRSAISQNRTEVSNLEREHLALRRTNQALRHGDQQGITEARSLGMQRPGEQPYHIAGLPGN